MGGGGGGGGGFCTRHENPNDYCNIHAWQGHSIDSYIHAWQGHSIDSYIHAQQGHSIDSSLCQHKDSLYHTTHTFHQVQILHALHFIQASWQNKPESQKNHMDSVAKLNAQQQNLIPTYCSRVFFTAKDHLHDLP